MTDHFKNQSLPHGWEESQFKDIAAYIQRGKSPKYAVHSNFPVINQKCIRWHGIDLEFLKYLDPNESHKWSQERYLQPGDILWNSTGTGTIGRASIYKGNIENAVADSHVTIIRLPTHQILPEYVFYFIMSPYVQKNIESMQSGSTDQVELGKTVIEETKIPLPPFAEQKRIVAKIEELFSEIDKGVEKLLKTQELLKTYRQSLLQNALEGKLTANWRQKNASFPKDCKQNISKTEQNPFLPELWINSRLGDLVSQVSKKRMPHEYPEYPFLGMDCLEKNALKPHFTYQFKELKSAGNWFNKNHILYGRLRPYLNKVYRAEYEGVASGEFIVLQSISMINPDWLKYVLHAQSFVNWSNKQTTGDKPRVRYDQIALYPINVPPQEEQDKIVQELESHLSICDKLERDICNKITQEFSVLRQGILKKAFSGELVHQDENDEPVSVLLERIKTEKEPKKTPKKKLKQLQKVAV